ncbi:MAG: hypothetical protein ABI882_06915 [Acidobacteriota bacterium]
MRKCAFLTTDNLEGFVSDDELAVEPLRELGWTVDAVSWRAHGREPGVDWDKYEAVVIRTTWDYHKDPQAFVETLEEIDSSRATLANPLELVRWNLHKSYLRGLEMCGVRVVPTHWGRDLDYARLIALFDILETDEIVIKPAIGASADDTFRVRRGSASEIAVEIETLFREREYMAQPFIQTVVDEGEYSLFYFGGEYSHTVLKTPKANDFRVQEEHGGEIRAVEVDSGLIERGLGVIRLLDVEPLYARVDYVRDGRGELTGEERFAQFSQFDQYALMELELIEPALYFRNEPHSAARFARAFDRWMRRR